VVGGLAAVALVAPASAGSRSVVSGFTKHREHVGECFSTRVRRVGTRLQEHDGRLVPGSGSEIDLADGHSNVSYDQLPGIDRSRRGDRVRLCVIGLPAGCPRGDTRGILYRGVNLRTHLSWKATDEEHQCGGA